jgi:hypothetical protein
MSAQLEKGSRLLVLQVDSLGDMRCDRRIAIGAPGRPNVVIASMRSALRFKGFSNWFRQ